MEKSNQKKLIIRNAILLILMFAAVLFFRWNCISTGGSKYQDLPSNEKSKIEDAVTEIPKYMVNLNIFENLQSDEMKPASGIILAFGEKMYILTDYESIKNAVSIQVEFVDKTKTMASLESVDEESGVAILSITQSEVSVDTRKILEKAKFGNSDNLKVDDEIALVNDTINYGKITSVSEYKSAMDGAYRLINTDILTVGVQSGFLISTEGKVVGMSNGTVIGEAVGSTDIIYIVNSFCNATDITYLGVYGEINDAENGGVMITDVESGSPAELAGITRGDIILKIDSKKVSSMKDVQLNLESKNKDDETTIELENIGEIKVILGGR